jgi:SecD/SecF fusion protein
VGATIADDIKGSAFEAGLFAVISIFLYILIRFKKWTYSLGAIVALIHDTLFVVAAFGIAGLFGISFEIDQVFVAAVLTIIGYSINDTVIIFDRIREYLGFGANHDRVAVFNDAINSTLSRTLITSGTTLIVVIVLLFFGGEVLRGFSFALFIGIVIGTYSSIFIASPVVLDVDQAAAKPVKA